MFKQDLKGNFTLEDITWEKGWGGKDAMDWMGGKESLQVKLVPGEHRVCLECQNRGLERQVGEERYSTCPLGHGIKDILRRVVHNLALTD